MVQNYCSPCRQGPRVQLSGVFAIPQTVAKCSLIVNLKRVQRAMRGKPEKFSLPSVELLALRAKVGRQRSSFLLPLFYGRAKCLRRVLVLLSLPGEDAGSELCMCHIYLNNCF